MEKMKPAEWIMAVYETTLNEQCYHNPARIAVMTTEERDAYYNAVYYEINRMSDCCCGLN